MQQNQPFRKALFIQAKKAPPQDDTAKVRQLKAAMTSSSEEDSEEEFIPVSLIVDSGSSVNLINSDTFKRLQSINQSIKLIPSKTKVFPYGTTTPIETKGQFGITICYKQPQTTATFHVTKSSPQGLLSYKTFRNLAYWQWKLTT